MNVINNMLTTRFRRLSGLVIVGVLALTTGVAVFLAFESNGNVSRLRAYELNRSLGKSHLDSYIFKKLPNESSASSPAEDFDSFKLASLIFPMSIKGSVQEYDLELSLRFSKQHNSQKTIRQSEEKLRDIAIQYFMQSAQNNIFEKTTISRAKRDLLLSFNDVLVGPIEGVYITNVRVKN